MQCFIIHLAYTFAEVEAQTPDFRFSTIYGDHMVLQQAPNQANVWGYTSSGDSVSVNFDTKDYPATTVTGYYSHTLLSRILQRSAPARL